MKASQVLRSVFVAVALVFLCGRAGADDCCAVVTPPAGCPSTYSCCSSDLCPVLQCSVVNEMVRQNVPAAAIGPGVCMADAICSYCSPGFGDLKYSAFGNIGLWRMSNNYCNSGSGCSQSYGSCVSCSTFRISLTEQVKLFKYLYSQDPTFTNSNVWPFSVRNAYSGCAAYQDSC